MEQAFFRTLRQMFDPTFLRVFGIGVIATALLVTAMVLSGTVGLLFALATTTAPAWAAWLLVAGWVVVGLVGAWWFFSAVLILITGLMLDEIIDAVERRWYPQTRATRRLGLAENLRVAFGFSVLVLLVNLVLLPVYVLMIFFPPAAALVFFLVNAWLFGREYFNAVALRHLDATAARGLRGRNTRLVLLGGAVITLAFVTPPFLLVAPIFGVALFTHLFHQMRAQPVVLAPPSSI